MVIFLLMTSLCYGQNPIAGSKDTCNGYRRPKQCNLESLCTWHNNECTVDVMELQLKLNELESLKAKVETDAIQINKLKARITNMQDNWLTQVSSLANQVNLLPQISSVETFTSGSNGKVKMTKAANSFCALTSMSVSDGSCYIFKEGKNWMLNHSTTNGVTVCAARCIEWESALP